MDVSENSNQDSNSSLGFQNNDMEIQRIRQEMEVSKKTLEQLEKEQIMLKNLEKERDRLNLIVGSEEASQQPAREMEEGEISDSEEEVIISEDDKDGQVDNFFQNHTTRIDCNVYYAN